MKQLLLIPILIVFAATAFAQSKQELKQQKKFLKNHQFVFIPSGTYNMGSRDQKFDRPEQLKPSVQTIESFYMMPYEVSNYDYLTYLESLETTDKELADSLYPDTLVWSRNNAYNNKYTDYYFRHPSYRNYPVVGVSYNKAVAYADWLTQQYNNKPDEEKVFAKVKFRLPTEEEWEYAARGGLELSDFPWGGPYMRNANGDHMANMVYISQASVYRDTVWIDNPDEENDSIKPAVMPTVRYLSTGASDYLRVAGQLNDITDITAPVDAYPPNGFGLYNMTGNVEEMVDLIGITRGGSWRDTGYYGMVSTRQFYQNPDFCSNEIGFRLVLEVVKY